MMGGQNNSSRGGMKCFLPEVALALSFLTFRILAVSCHWYWTLLPAAANVTGSHNKARLSSLSFSHSHANSHKNHTHTQMLDQFFLLASTLPWDDTDWTIFKPIKWILLLEQYVIRTRIPLQFWYLGQQMFWEISIKNLDFCLGDSGWNTACFYCIWFWSLVEM